MATENRFNLVDEPWIPVVDHGRVSLRDIFSNRKYPALGGNPVQKIALTKLLLAIAQAAETPEDDDAWETMGADGMAANCISYLDIWHDRFWLYGEKPFLQMPAINQIKKQNYGNFMPSVATGNTTVFTQTQVEYSLTDDERALLLIQLMGFALGGKQVDNSKPLSGGYAGNLNPNGKAASGRAGRSAGYLHCFFVGESLLETLYMNLLSKNDINGLSYFRIGVGTPPWEKMPMGEICPTARELKNSYFGCLVPLCRFVFLETDGLFVADGILYDRGSKQAPKRSADPALTFDPMLSVNLLQNDFRILFVDSEKKPWRELTSLLSFFENSTGAFSCAQIRMCINRIRRTMFKFGIWGGGMSFSDKAGEHAPRGTDDYTESRVMLENNFFIDPSGWLVTLQHEMNELNHNQGQLTRCVYNFNRREIKDSKEKDKRAEAISKQSANIYWQLCEQDFQNLVNASVDIEQIRKIRRIFAGHVFKLYDTFCPRESARQLDAWAKNRPNLSKYQN